MRTSSCEAPRAALRRQLLDNAYPGYVYGYPHKKAYRPLPRPVPLAEAWAGEPRSALFCYAHLPFCRQRCSFCNLFTYVPANGSPVAGYIDALAREMGAYAAALPGASFARLYLGGGTPTFLTSAELRRLVGHLRDVLGVDPARADGCIEASPDTLDEDKVGLLRELGFQRLSLGVQSFVPGELRDVNRRFDFASHARALEWIRRARFPHFNVDLIYGLPGQTRASWRHSLEQAIASAATSLFLYPLYVRPLTGLDRRADLPPAPTPHEMGGLYDDAVGLLAQAGFRQLTMRQFRRDAEPAGSDLEYRCQLDGMVGLGAGARSYTRALHYSTLWRMVARNVRAEIDDYGERMRRGDTAAFFGFALDDDERRRRFVIQSLLFEGLDLADFERAFGGDALALFAGEWEALVEERCVTIAGSAVRLTARGTRHSDVVGQLFFSERVRDLMATYEYDA
jgi:oxygen-independent coproporphyrinogen-3 oxidase